MMELSHRLLGAHSFAILNPLQLEHRQWGGLPVTGLVPPILSSKAPTMPQLLDLASLSNEQRSALLERVDRWDRDSDTPFFSLLIKSTATSTQVAAHLSRQLIVRAPDGSDALLRWYDPRVIRHLYWLLAPEQLRALSGPVATWTWREHDSHWATHEVPIAADRVVRLRIDDEQWSAVGRFGVLNRTILQLGRSATSPCRDDGLYRRIDACLREAYELHELTDEADVRLFAEQAIRYPGIQALPEVARRLTRARRGEISYVGACVDLDIDSIHVPGRNPLRKDAVT